MAATTGLGQFSIRSSTDCSEGSVGGLPNSVMSAPAMNVRPAQVMTTARTAASEPACMRPSCRPWRTWRLRAFTGGLLTVKTATLPRRSRSTDSVIFVMGSLDGVGLWVKAGGRRRVALPLAPVEDGERDMTVADHAQVAHEALGAHPEMQETG